GKRVKCVCGQVMTAPAPVQVPSRAIAYATRDVATPDPLLDKYFPDRVKDFWLPLWLIAGGTAVYIVAALLSRNPFVTTSAVLAGLGYRMIVNAAIMLGTCFVVSKIRDISFGPIVTAATKLCAIAIAPDALCVLLGNGLIGWLADLVLYFALIGALFDLDQSD